ncbi:hypothetical protein CBM2637_A30024 [Cupriavidus taiwanensis]|nr:hypothetical protein CBM2637_A30024 [Cupriavidus taiwanensis]
MLRAGPADGIDPRVPVVPLRS